MSKVKGNVIDPLDLIHGATFDEMVEKTLPGAPEAEALAKFKKAYPSAAAMGNGFPAFGADARALHARHATRRSNKRIALAPKRIEGYRHFCNKIWNATRFALELPRGTARGSATRRRRRRRFVNRWILSRLAAACAAAHDGHRRRSASTRRRSRSTASSGTTSATGTSSSRSPSSASAPTARRSPSRRGDARRRSRTCSRRRCASCTRSCRSSPRSSGSACRGPASRKVEPRVRPVPDAGRRARVARRRRPSAWMELLQGGHLGGAHDPQRARPRQEGRRSRCAVRSGEPRGPRVPARARRGDPLARADAGRPGRSRRPGGPREPGTTVSMVASAPRPHRGARAPQGPRRPRTPRWRASTAS